jgi:hypothetical protein
MVAGADSIDAMDLPRHGGMGQVLIAGRAPSTLGTFPRAFTFDHFRQLDAAASRLLVNLVARAQQPGEGAFGVVGAHPDRVGEELAFGLQEPGVTRKSRSSRQPVAAPSCNVRNPGLASPARSWAQSEALAHLRGLRATAV